METYLTIEELAGYLKLAVQTIRRYVLNREIPFCKIKKVIRFRLSEIERWIDGGAKVPDATGNVMPEDGLFAGEATDGSAGQAGGGETA